MALDDYQHTVLRQMGIPIWQRRETVTQPSLPDTPLEAVLAEDDERRQQQDWLLFMQPPSNEMEQRLLTAILAAIDLSITQVASFQVDEIAVIKQALSDKQRLLIFGHEATLLGMGKAVFSIPTLAELLQTPAQKRQAWQTLQQYQAIR